MCIAALACGESGSVRPGTCRGASETPNASTTSVMATRRLASSRQGSSFSTAISPAMATIHGQAHHAEGEQRRHQSPAAADAPRAVHDAHAQRSRGPVTPVGEHEVKRCAAAAQAGVLDGRELVDRRREEHTAGEVGAAAMPRQRGDRERAHADIQAVRDQPERRPRQEIPAHEHPRGDGAIDRTRDHAGGAGRTRTSAPSARSTETSSRSSSRPTTRRRSRGSPGRCRDRRPSRSCARASAARRGRPARAATRGCRPETARRMLRGGLRDGCHCAIDRNAIWSAGQLKLSRRQRYG